MITVTDSAKELLQAVDQSQEHPDDQVLRVDPVGEQQFGIGYGEPAADDQVVEHNGETVVHVSNDISTALDGATLDRVDTPQGTTLAFTAPQGFDPNAK